MTIKEYILSEIAPFTYGSAVSFDMFLLSLDPDATYNVDNEVEVNKAMIATIERLMFRPRLEQINENGFSATINYADLGKYYQYLCKRYGVEPNADVLMQSGISMIKDISDCW